MAVRVNGAGFDWLARKWCGTRDSAADVERIDGESFFLLFLVRPCCRSLESHRLPFATAPKPVSSLPL